MKTENISHAQVDEYVVNIIKDIHHRPVRRFPDIVIAPQRGGLYVGAALSYYFECEFKCLDLKSCSPNFFYVIGEDNDKQILVCDDINDTGNTFKKIGEMVDSMPNLSARVHYAALIENTESGFVCDFAGRTVTKQGSEPWYIFPWEFKDRANGLIDNLVEWGGATVQVD